MDGYERTAELEELRSRMTILRKLCDLDPLSDSYFVVTPLEDIEKEYETIKKEYETIKKRDREAEELGDLKQTCVMLGCIVDLLYGTSPEILIQRGVISKEIIDIPSIEGCHIYIREKLHLSERALTELSLDQPTKDIIQSILDNKGDKLTTIRAFAKHLFQQDEPDRVIGDIFTGKKECVLL